MTKKERLQRLLLEHRILCHVEDDLAVIASQVDRERIEDKKNFVEVHMNNIADDDVDEEKKITSIKNIITHTLYNIGYWNKDDYDRISVVVDIIDAKDEKEVINITLKRLLYQAFLYEDLENIEMMWNTEAAFELIQKKTTFRDFAKKNHEKIISLIIDEGIQNEEKDIKAKILKFAELADLNIDEVTAEGYIVAKAKSKSKSTTKATTVI